MTTARDLLLEIGCEELPASFVEGAIAALPELAKKRLDGLRLGFTSVRALGTPRRLALIVEGLAARQRDLEEELVGPPVKAAFKDGAPTKAAEAFATKVGVAVGELRQVETPKGTYLTGTKREAGRAAEELLPEALAALVASIPFRKSMRWGSSDFAFGRPIQWLVALLDERVVPVTIAGLTSGRTSRGHRFLGKPAVEIARPADYEKVLEGEHVIASPTERARRMRDALAHAAKEAGGELIEDEFLVGENLSLVEEPHVVVGGFEEHFLELPERVILEVAKGHQRYFGVRAKGGGKLLPKYLAIVNTAARPDTIRRGNDNTMRARLADARFFYTEDVKVPLADRRKKLGDIVFQKKLGSVLAKAERVERLARELGLLLMLPEATVMAAASGAHLAKCDLVALMVGEFPELQGEMGAAYALAQGVSPEVAGVIRGHYQPKGASDRVAETDAAALVAMADRLDTLVGCFGIGLTPTGAADPFGLRRACIGVLRTALERGLDVRLTSAFRAAIDGFAPGVLEVPAEALAAKLSTFFAERLRGVLESEFPADVVAACLAFADRPLDARARASAIATLDAATRARVGEVFKRASNIGASAPEGGAGEAVALPAGADAHASERALVEGFGARQGAIAAKTAAGDYAGGFAEVAALAPLLHQYFADVFVMSDDLAVRDARLRLMRAISQTCRSLAELELLGQAPSASAAA